MDRGQFHITEEIDGIKVSSQMFDPLEVYRLTPRIVCLFVPVLQLQATFTKLAPVLMKALHGKAALSAADAMTALKSIEVSELTPVVQAIAERLALPENARLPVELLKRTQLLERDAEGMMRTLQLTSEADINDAFRGRPLLMLKLMWFAAVFNFGAFFRGGQPSALINSSVTSTTIG